MTTSAASSWRNYLLKIRAATDSWYSQVLFYLALVFVFFVVDQVLFVGVLPKYFFDNPGAMSHRLFPLGEWIPALANAIALAVVVRIRTLVGYLLATFVLTHFVLATAFHIFDIKYFVGGLYFLESYVRDFWPAHFSMLWTNSWFCGGVIGLLVNFYVWGIDTTSPLLASLSARLLKLRAATGRWYQQVLLYLAFVFVFFVIDWLIVADLYNYFFSGSGFILNVLFMTGAWIPLFSNVLVIVLATRARTLVGYLLIVAVLTSSLAAPYYIISGGEARYGHDPWGTAFALIIWTIVYFLSSGTGLVIKFFMWRRAWLANSK